MELKDFIQNTGEWLKGTGEHANIVMSSRIRLARNLAFKPFPNRASKKELDQILESVQNVVAQNSVFKDTFMVKMNELDAIDRQFLIERHLMSPDLAENPDGRALVVSRQEVLSIMVNEEDHLRIQVMESGLNLEELWKMADKIDDALAAGIDYAYSMQWGYLTACPTNTGTAIRGSVMLHLPALVMTKQINKVLSAVAKLNFAARGFYGEGTQASGNFYQISNQVSLGHSEMDVIQNIRGLILQIIEQEEQARQALLLQNKLMLEDKIFRSYGILKNAYVISSQETVDLFSMLRLGIDLGVINDVNIQDLNSLLIMTQPAHLQKIEGKKLSSSERDKKRAAIIRQKLGGE